MADNLSKLSSIKGLTVRRDAGTNPLPGQITGCNLCAKPFLLRSYFKTPDLVCPECFETYKDCAKIICRKCSVVIARVAPEVLESGYVIRRNALLHIDACGRCQPDIQTSTVVEIAEWEHRVGRRKTIIEVRFK